ncbi:hypothetical protein MNB_SV-8-242 [hydrothermal vent metagenome]|uniref:Uncharacterized protein n=1 Tax=hydrothermal vent metagenome TaxID=652676 RepID=A0A1W1BZH6_9ZZZZ
MLNKIENVFILKIISILVLCVGILYFYKYVSIQEAITSIIGCSAFAKALSDVVYETGNKNIYKYDESKNKKLRYLALIVMGCLNIVFVLIVVFR